jgi:hypothetical protein
MMKNKYTTNPKEVYELELNKLQLCFSELQQLGEDASELARINWRHVEHLRHVNFILQEATMTGKAMLKLPLTN